MTELNHHLEEKILASIEKGEVKMKPKSYFVVKSVALGAAGVILVLLTLYLGSFLLYAAKLRFSWELFALVILSLIILELFVNRFGGGYRRPILISFGLLLAVVVGASFFLRQTNAHEQIKRYVRTRHVPGLERLYKHYGPPLREELHDRR